MSTKEGKVIATVELPDEGMLPAIEIPTTGKFVETLKRNFKQIREDRAESLAETVAMLYKRSVEDIQMQIRQLQRDRDNMMDLSPASVTSLTLPSDFSPEEFVEKDVEIGVRIRNLGIKLQIATARYNQLFGAQ